MPEELPTSAQKLIRLMALAIPRMGPLLPRALARTETHLVLVLETKTSVLVPRMTDEERAQFTHEYSAHLVTLSRVRELVLDGAEEALASSFDLAMAQPRPTGSVMVVVAVDSALGFQVVAPEEVQAIIAGHAVEAVVGLFPRKADGRGSLLAMYREPIPVCLGPDRIEALLRYQDLVRGIEAAEASKDPPGTLADVLYERFDGAALEAAIEATDAEGKGEEQVFQVFKTAVDRVAAEMAA